MCMNPAECCIVARSYNSSLQLSYSSCPQDSHGAMMAGGSFLSQICVETGQTAHKILRGIPKHRLSSTGLRRYWNIMPSCFDTALLPLNDDEYELAAAYP